jgi:hypothetical protein
MQEEHMSTDGGSISPAGRFQRMEDALDRIETKLDAKADLLRLESLERHVADMESGRVMSPINQQLLLQFNKSLSDISDLKRWQDVQTAQVAAEKEQVKTIADARYNSLRTLVGIVSVINGVVIVAFSILTALHVLP